MRAGFRLELQLIYFLCVYFSSLLVRGIYSDVVARAHQNLNLQFEIRSILLTPQVIRMDQLILGPRTLGMVIHQQFARESAQEPAALLQSCPRSGIAVSSWQRCPALGVGVRAIEGAWMRIHNAP